MSSFEDGIWTNLTDSNTAIERYEVYDMTSVTSSSENNALTVVEQNTVPENLPILPVEQQVAFPGLNMTLSVNSDALPSLEEAMKDNQIIGIVGTEDQKEKQPGPEWDRRAGTAVKILYITPATEDSVVLVVHGLKRFRMIRWLSDTPYLRAQVEMAPETVETGIEIEALHRSLRDLSREVFAMSLKAPKEALEALSNVKDPLRSAYIAAAHADIDFEKRQSLLDEDSLKMKLRDLVALLSREKEVLSLGKKIQSDVQDEMNKTQRDFYLRQQLRAIKKELGETDKPQSEAEVYRQRIEDTDIGGASFVIMIPRRES